MGDLFCEKKVARTPEDKILRAIFGDNEETWQKREEEAASFLSEYIDGHSDELEEAMVTSGELRGLLHDQMEHLRDDYIVQGKNQVRDAYDSFLYARMICVLRVLHWLIGNMEEKDGRFFVPLCDKGCKAAQMHRKEETGWR